MTAAVLAPTTTDLATPATARHTRSDPGFALLAVLLALLLVRPAVRVPRAAGLVAASLVSGAGSTRRRGPPLPLV